VLNFIQKRDISATEERRRRDIYANSHEVLKVDSKA